MSTLAYAERLETAVLVREDGSRADVEAFLSTHPDARSYHRHAWLDVIRLAFGHRTAYLTAQRDGRVVGVLPLVFFESRLFGRFAVSMPFLNYGGALADAHALCARLLCTTSTSL